ncbi:MAG: DUF1365 domain-containing protein [Reyranellaceae bacterium]
MTPAVEGGLVLGKVFHKRLRPHPHAFRYAVPYFCVPLSRADWFDRGGFVSLNSADHGARDGSPLQAWISAILERYDLDRLCDGEILLLTLPRQFGYVFNPVSFWSCLDRAGALRAVLCEVANTFGDRHNYLVAHDDGRPIAADDWIEGRKVFHVSPFLPVEGTYRFRFAVDERAISAQVHYHDAEGLMLATGLDGPRCTLDRTAVLRRFVANPLVALAVIFRIHWQAFGLWRKRTRFHPRPEPPGEMLTR